MESKHTINLSFILLGIVTMMFLIGFSGCYVAPNYEVYGIGVYDNEYSIPKSETRLVLNESIELWKSIKHVDTRDIFIDNPIDLYYKDKLIECGYKLSPKTGLCYGLTYSYRMEVFVDKNRYCLVYAILLHELGHAISDRLFFNRDAKHEDDEIFGEYGIVSIGYSNLIFNNSKCIGIKNENLILSDFNGIH